MVVTVPSVLPDMSLAPSKIARKFDRGMRGLGAGEFDQYVSPGDISFSTGSILDGPGNFVTFDHSLDTTSTDLTGYFDQIGIAPPEPGTPVAIPTAGGGKVVYVNRGTAASPNWAPVVGAITSGIFDIAKLLTIQPGTVQQPGVTLRQSPGYPVTVPQTQTGVNVAATTGGGLMMAAAAVLIAMMFLRRQS